ncbi:MAG: hypothetical protein H6Q90_4492 [Deltaproteobacteria bacterium]|nr:hypothetical protein [Deltaproteobacteria bacterium]
MRRLPTATYRGASAVLALASSLAACTGAASDPGTCASGKCDEPSVREQVFWADYAGQGTSARVKPAADPVVGFTEAFVLTLDTEDHHARLYRKKLAADGAAAGDLLYESAEPVLSIESFQRDPGRPRVPPRHERGVRVCR